MYLHKTKNGHYTPPCCYFSGELKVVEGIRNNGGGWAMLIAYHRGKLEEIAGTELYAKYAVTQKACDAIRIERKIPLLWMERQALKKVSGRNRKQGISLANRKSIYWKSLQMNARK